MLVLLSLGIVFVATPLSCGSYFAPIWCDDSVVVRYFLAAPILCGDSVVVRTFVAAPISCGDSVVVRSWFVAAPI